jgi:sigma-E factor negative regulatory protein RseA
MNSAAQSESTSAPAAAPADPRGEELSAWLDGELEAQTAEPLVRELLQPGDGRRQFDEWCLVGDALRSHEVAAGHSPRLCARIAEAINGEPALLAPQALPARRRRPSAMTRHIASGVAIAAAAAVVVLVALPQLRSGSGGPAEQLADRRAPVVQTVDAPAVALASTPAGTVANAMSGGNGANRNPRLDPYIQAHRDFSGAGVMPAAAVYLRFGNEGDR